MLDKLPPRVMEGILTRLDPWSHLQLALSCPEMWDAVEETPKKYHTVRWIDRPAECCNQLFLRITQRPEEVYEEIIPLYELKPPEWALPLDDIPLLKAGCKGTDTSLYRTALIRLLLLNSTIHEMSDAPFSFGHKFWASLNLKVTRIADPADIPSFESLRKFLDLFHTSQLVCQKFIKLVQVDPHRCADFLTHPMIRSLDSMHMRFYLGVLDPFRHIRAKKMLLDVQFQAQIFKWTIIGEFLEHKIRHWLRGEQEIDRIHIITAPVTHAEHNLSTFVARLSRKLPAELGWIDRTYQGMELVLRATDGQALIVFFDKPDFSIYLIRCQYNFRRGRCLGSYERNQKSLALICQLMCIYGKLHEEKPLLAADAKEKLREECCNFNKYNNGATTVDLATDAIWRPTGKRRSPWGVSRGRLMRGTFPMDRSLRHAYQFTKAFEERGVLPDVDEFPQATAEEIESWNSHCSELIS